MDLLDVWPLFRLRLRTPRLELRLARDEDLAGIVAAALAGIHDPTTMPFAVPWTDAEPEVLRREVAKHQWRLRVRADPDDWVLSLIVLRDGVPIGLQDVQAQHFGVLRTVTSGSWLTRAQQGRGLGTEMRAAALLLAFDHLGAEFAESSAADWNAASLAVSRRLGYRPNGTAGQVARPGEAMQEQRVRLARGEFVRPAWSLEAEGIEVVRAELLRDA